LHDRLKACYLGSSDTPSKRTAEPWENIEDQRWEQCWRNASDIRLSSSTNLGQTNYLSQA